MFNKTFVMGGGGSDGPSHVTHNTTIHEHRAPTDDSIKMLNEMHEKVNKSITAKYPIESNFINGEIWICDKEYGMGETIGVVMKVNNEDVSFEFDLPMNGFRDERIQEKMDRIIQKICEHITSRIISPIIVSTIEKHNLAMFPHNWKPMERE